MKQRSRFKLYVVITSLPLFLLLHLSSHLELTTRQYQRDVPIGDNPHLPTSSELAVASLNYRTAATDLLWLRAVLYTSEQRLLRKPPEELTHYANAIIDLDPYFYPIYYHHYSFRFEHHLNPTHADLKASNRILTTGLDYFPEAWKLARALMLSYLHPGIERTDEQRIAELEQAIYYARLSIETGETPDIMTSLTISFRNRLAHLLEDNSNVDSADPSNQLSSEEVDFFVRQYFTADDKQRHVIFGHLRSLGAEEDFLERIEQFETRFRVVHHHSFPYLSPELFLLVDSNLYVWHDQGEFEGL